MVDLSIFCMFTRPGNTIQTQFRSPFWIIIVFWYFMLTRLEKSMLTQKTWSVLAILLLRTCGRHVLTRFGPPLKKRQRRWAKQRSIRRHIPFFGSLETNRKHPKHPKIFVFCCRWMWISCFFGNKKTTTTENTPHFREVWVQCSAEGWLSWWRLQ